jgi:uncharacterized protein
MPPHAHISVVTLGVSDVARSSRFYEELGFIRKVRKTGDEVAFLEAGGVVLACWGEHELAKDSGAGAAPRPEDFRGIALAWNCASPEDVEVVIAVALKAGATCLKAPQNSFYGGYYAYFADPDGHVWEIAHNPQFPLTPEGRLQLPD